MRFIVRSLRQLRRSPRDWLMRRRDDGLQMVRVSIAATLSWLISERLLPDATPVLAPLTAILCVQVTVYRSVTTALQRAAGVPSTIAERFALCKGRPAISRSPKLNSGEDLGPGGNAGHGCHNARTRDKWLSPQDAGSVTLPDRLRPLDYRSEVNIHMTAS